MGQTKYLKSMSTQKKCFQRLFPYFKVDFITPQITSLAQDYSAQKQEISAPFLYRGRSGDALFIFIYVSDSQSPDALIRKGTVHPEGNFLTEILQLLLRLLS